MQNWGKFIGAVIGLVLFDLVGIPLGWFVGGVLFFVLGHYFIDLPMNEQSQKERQSRAYRRRQGDFVYHVFRLGAKVAKADGQVSRAEVNFMESLMEQQFRLPPKGRKEAISIWNQAKNSREPFSDYAVFFYRDFAMERHQLLSMLDLLFAIAACDGAIHSRQEELLLQAAGIFQISRVHFDRIRSRYIFQGRGAPPPPPQARPNALAAHYRTLGASPEESLDDLKKKFRALALKWHPDKVAASGADQKELKRANEKFQQINDAYEQILEARKA